MREGLCVRKGGFVCERRKGEVLGGHELFVFCCFSITVLF